MILFLITVTALMVRFVPPSNVFVVFLFIALVSTAVFTMTGYTGSKRIQAMATAFIFLQLSINYAIGFDVINTILLISFIIAVSKLFK